MGILRKIIHVFNEHIEDQRIREAFNQETREISPQWTFIGAILGLCSYPVFAILDYVVYPDKYFILWILRVIFIISIMPVFILKKTAFFKKHALDIGLFIIFMSALVVTTMCHFTGGPSSLYYQGLNLTILVGVVVFHFDVRRAFILCIVSYAYFNSPLLFFGLDHYTSAEKSVILSNNFFILLNMSICIVGTYYKNNVRLKQLIGRKNLAEANEQLKKLDQMKSQFFANVSHEVRTPLTSIIAPVQSLFYGDMGQLSAEQRGTVYQVYRNSLRLLDLINQMLDFAKIEAGKMQVRIEQVNVDELVHDTVTLFEDVTERKGIKLRYSKDGEIPPMYLDKDKFERILTNLIRNAIKFTDSGSIFVRLRVDGGFLDMEVEDTGIGIPAEHLPHIFERFKQVDTSSTRKFQGTGLGLTLVKESVDLMKGRISVSSQEKKGTRFKILLPTNLREQMPDAFTERRADDRRQMNMAFGGDNKREDYRRRDDLAKITAEDIALIEKQVTEPTPAEAGTSGDEQLPRVDRVLLVEDNADLRHYMSKMLSKFGHEVMAESDGLDGWERAQKDLPDIIVSDVMMPRMDGYELIENVKSNTKTAHIPIILITAKPEMESKLTGLKKGADDYLPKPINIRELDARIRNIVTLRKMQVALANADALEARMEELTMSFAQSLETRDFKTAGHSKDVLELGTLVAEELGIPVDRKLKDSLMLHDIGKLGIPDGILLKESKLSEDEWRIMKKHPEMGANLLKNFDTLRDVSKIILAHQEHFDGTGYPKGLKGDEIPLIARIIGVADAYHAMTNDRPYRKALESRVAIKELLKYSGKQFDPAVVDAFVQGLLKRNLITEEDLSQARSMI